MCLNLPSEFRFGAKHMTGDAVYTKSNGMITDLQGVACPFGL